MYSKRLHNFSPFLLFIVFLISIRYRDGDSVINAFDNCVDVPNADQSDVDNDGKGDTVLTLL